MPRTSKKFHNNVTAFTWADSDKKEEKHTMLHGGNRISGLRSTTLCIYCLLHFSLGTQGSEWPAQLPWVSLESCNLSLGRFWSLLDTRNLTPSGTCFYLILLFPLLCISVTFPPLHLTAIVPSTTTLCICSIYWALVETEKFPLL